MDVEDGLISEFAMANANVVDESGVGVEVFSAWVCGGNVVDELGPPLCEKVVDTVCHEVEVEGAEVED